MLHPRSGATVCGEKTNFMGKTKVRLMLTAQPKPRKDPISEPAVLTLCKKADETRSCLKLRSYSKTSLGFVDNSRK